MSRWAAPRSRLAPVSERRRSIAVGACAVVGLVGVCLGIWGLIQPPPEWMPFQVAVAPVGGIVAGVILLGFALVEMFHRRVKRRHSTLSAVW